MTDRLMPSRVFFGSSGNMMISSVRTDFSGDRRPLLEGERQLGAFILPPFQRPLVWTETQKVRLIESIYLGLPIGSLVWNQTALNNPCDRWLLDGQQRVSAIIGWYQGEFAVNGWRYPDLPDIEKRHFDRCNVACIESNITDALMCRDLYDRLAYGGTTHAPKG